MQAKFLPPVAAGPKVIPVGLDTVFRLGQDQNLQIQIARARLDEALAGQDMSRMAWLPQISFGPTYARHEGGIQDFQGNLVHSSYGSLFGGMDVHARLDPRDIAFQRVDAERRVWQQQGELSKLTNENLLDAANTYFDLLAARASEGLSVTVEKQLTDLLEQANVLAKLDKGLQVEVERIEAELRAHRLIMSRLHEGGDAAAAKLAYLLGVDPACVLAPIESHLVPIDLVNVNCPVQALIEKALSAGPGIREMEGLLRLIDETRAAAQGPGKWMPALEINANEGAFGAGPGSRMAWDNQFNVGMNLRWNLTEAITAKDRLRQADCKAAQAHLSYQDLRARLSLGVTEAHGAIVAGLEQKRLAEEQIAHAESSYALSASRFKESIKGRSSSEVLMAARAMAGARLQYIQTIRDLDKAEVRLFLLVRDGCEK